MNKLTLVLVTLAFGACEDTPYIGEDCPPTTEAGAECRQGDLNENCRELIPGHNVVNRSLNNKLAGDRINFVLTAINRTSEEAYIIFREEIDKLTQDDFFRNNGLLINYWYVPTEYFMERGDPSNFGEEGREASTMLAEECLVENKFPLNYQHWGFVPNADLNISFLSTFSDKEMRAIINARMYAPNDDSCRKTVEECWGEGCIFNEFFSKEEYTSRIASNLICNLEYSPNSVRFSWPVVAYTFAHEIGHSVFGFYDEYDHGLTEDQELNDSWITMYEDYPVNCFVGTHEECFENAPWKNHIGKLYRGERVGCYEGCGYQETGVFRATKYGLMKNPWLPNGYGLPNEIRGCKILAMLTNRASEFCKEFNSVLEELEE